MTFRWFGAGSDPVTLRQIRQIPGMTGIMGGLSNKPPGVVWEADEIRAYVSEVHAAGLACEVIESVNVHEDIKLGLPSREAYIANYAQTIRNLAANGVKAVVYNFMPVLDWLRTDLSWRIADDGSYSMYYDERDLNGLTPSEVVGNMTNSANGFSLAGYSPERLAVLEKTLARYKTEAGYMPPEQLLEHFRYFLDRVIPVCEECGVVMACHSDDPAWPIFGLPRIAYSDEGLAAILALHNSPAHSLCLCTGSLATDPANDIPAMIRRFGAQGRVACMHIRNIKHLGYRRFYESAHLSADGDLDMYAVVAAVYESCPDVYVRPDHGRMIWDEQGRPGYGLYDRALGAAYINGLWEAIEKNAKQ